MKYVLERLLPVLVFLGGVFLLVAYQERAAGPEEIIDRFVDAGIEFSTSPVELRLLEDRKIVIGADINAATTQRIVRALLFLDTVDGNRPIDLYIRTEGGWLDDAFSIVNVMQSIKAPVNTHAIGGTHSSGAMVLAAGTGVRYAYPYSSIMFHGGLYDADGDYGENTMDNGRLIAFWERHTRIPRDWLHTQDETICYVGPEKALELGLVDQIRAGKPEIERQPSAVEK